MHFCDKLAALRKQKKLSQIQVAEYLTQNGSPLTQKGISKWECGDTLPNAEQFLLLCRLYEIRDVLSVFFEYTDEAQKLNDLGKDRLNEYAQLLKNDARFINAGEKKAETLVLYDLCAGSSANERRNKKVRCEIERSSEIPKEATMALKLGDESMTPLFEKGQILYIKEQETLAPGEFGLFIYEDTFYCRLMMEAAETELVSVNEAFPPIRIRDKNKFKVVGRVIS